MCLMNSKNTFHVHFSLRAPQKIVECPRITSMPQAEPEYLNRPKGFTPPWNSKWTPGNRACCQILQLPDTVSVVPCGWWQCTEGPLHRPVEGRERGDVRHVMTSQSKSDLQEYILVHFKNQRKI